MENTITKKNTKDSKYENEQRTLKDRPRTDAPDRHPSVTAQLSNTSPYRLVPEKKGEKGVSIKIYSVSSLLVGSFRILILVGNHDLSRVSKESDLSYNSPFCIIKGLPILCSEMISVLR